MISYFVEVVVGLAAGLAVGSGFVAFLTVLGIIPRLVQISNSNKLIRFYEWAVILGVLFGIYITFSNQIFEAPIFLEVYWGLLHGIFVGMLAAALTEVLNVFPILAKRMHVDDYIALLVLAIVFGKILGSLFQWIIFVN
ncbi:stage V sporulation protein AB [Alkalibacillus silvisoli]|uniref:Stage V sporulation protein SpoVAB n=1 Tax=Alkalibacillus silvisoli TaxID=392823 RepID=A0ABN0ZTR4_9BACI